MNAILGGSATQTRPAYGYEQANSRVGELTSQIDEQVRRLQEILAPILIGSIPTIGSNQKEPIPDYGSDLLLSMNDRAERLMQVSAGLEHLIERIRL